MLIVVEHFDTFHHYFLTPVYPPLYLTLTHKWRKGQRFVGVFVHHGSCFGLGDRVKVTTVDILIRCDGVAPW